ncbi:MAG: glutamine--tRNA ligase, partial [Sphingobacteriia bacterium]|nr:glutamine--tRNA ligase [Sphingobacteriia bacterium]
VSAIHAVDAEIRLFDRLFRVENPEDVAEGEDYKINLNPDSLKILTHCKLEPELTNAVPGEKFQFQRLGYFTVDPETTPGNLVFNRTVPLKDSWTKSNQ